LLVDKSKFLTTYCYTWRCTSCCETCISRMHN